MSAAKKLALWVGSAVASLAVKQAVLALIAAVFAALSVALFVKGQTDRGTLGSLQAEVTGLQREAVEIKQRETALHAEKASLAEEKSALEKRLADVVAEKDSALKSERERLAAERAAIEAEKQKALDAQKALEEELRRTVASKDVVISKLEGRLKVNVAERLLFPTASASLTEEGQGVLLRVAESLRKASSPQEIRVEGHTDNVPIGAALAEIYPTNWELSAARAAATVRFLQTKGQLPAQRLAAVGYGEARPVAPNDTPENRARNRRVEIVLTPVAAAD